MTPLATDGPASGLAALRDRAVSSLRRWANIFCDVEADLIASEGDSDLIGKLEVLAGLIEDARLGFTQMDGGAVTTTRQADLEAAWRKVEAEMALQDPLAPAVPDGPIAAMRRLLDLLDSLSAPASAEIEEFRPGALQAAQLRDALSAAVSKMDWAGAEQRFGVRFPSQARQSPFEIHVSDGFDGAAPVKVSYPSWASAPVRLGLRRLLNGQWLSEVREAHGDDALGARLAPEPIPDAHLCRVLFGTDRAQKDGMFTGGRASGANRLTLGEARISVPNRRKRGVVSRPWRILGAQLPANPHKHIVLLGPARILSHEQFLTEAKSVRGDGSAFLFVHGYNSHFESGLWRTAQLATDLDIAGTAFHYAWPSLGDPTAYDYDSESIRNAKEPFKTFVSMLLNEAGISRLSVIAHSKGGELVLDVFQEMAKEAEGLQRAQHLVLASPDVDARVAEGWMPHARSFFESVTLYTNAHDRPLRLSARKGRGPRLGGMMPDGYPFIADGVETIDAADTDFSLFGFNHDAYVDAPVLMYDLAALIARGVHPPNVRSPVIRPETCDRGAFYRVVTA